MMNADTRERIERIKRDYDNYILPHPDDLKFIINKLHALTAFAEESKWLPISSAPKDGTVIDLFVNGSRHPNYAWGKPPHECGESGMYCDSDWHSEKPGWYDTTFNYFLHESPTHWMPLPEPPIEKDEV